MKILSKVLLSKLTVGLRDFFSQRKNTKDALLGSLDEMIVVEFSQIFALSRPTNLDNLCIRSTPHFCNARKMRPHIFRSMTS